jgi:hypothetical protein
MPLTIKADIYGSSKTQWVYGAGRSRAQRIFLVTDPAREILDNSNLDYDRAIDAVKGEHSNYLVHPADINLAISQMRATRYGPYKIYVTVDYEYKHGGGFSQPVTLVQTDKPGKVSIPVWRSAYHNGSGEYRWDWEGTSYPQDTHVMGTNDTGLPIGDIMYSGGKPQQDMWQRPITVVTVYTTLFGDPYATHGIGELIDSVNGGPVIFEPWNQGELRGFIQEECVRFDGAYVEKRSNSVLFDVWYQFSIIYGKWYKQEAFISPALGNYVDNVPMYPARNWWKAFPLFPGNPVAVAAAVNEAANEAL